MTSEETIGRFEIKYPVEPVRAARFLHDLDPLLVPDSHGRDGCYSIFSVYFDTRDLSCFREKIEGVPSRVKFRLRHYPDGAEGAWYLESKTRVRHYVRKERQRLRAPDAVELSRRPLTPASLARLVPSSHPLIQQVAARLSRGVMVPTVGVYYRRRALIFRGARNLRLTVDHSLEARPAAIPHDLSEPPRRGLGSDPWIVEIKGHGVLPVEVQDALFRNNLVARSFSKYCECVARRRRPRAEADSAVDAHSSNSS